jgi:hypothetical protein
MTKDSSGGASLQPKSYKPIEAVAKAESEVPVIKKKEKSKVI